MWLAPEQIRLITVNQEDATVQLAAKVHEEGRKLGLRVKVDNSNESVGKKIRDAEVWKVPYTVVLGEKEIQGGQITPRIRRDIEVQPPVAMSIEHFLKTAANEVASRVKHSSM